MKSFCNANWPLWMALGTAWYLAIMNIFGVDLSDDTFVEWLFAIASNTLGGRFGWWLAERERAT